jgi:hypothetical protein
VPHEGGRTLVDVTINEAQAKAHPDGGKLLERLDAAIAGTNAEPIHVSTGLLVEPIEANGESRGKKYTRKATKLNYDHLAILLDERGAGTPDDGVGMFLNSAGQAEEVEVCQIALEPEDKRTKGFGSWMNRLLSRVTGNAASELSFDQIRDGLWRALATAAGDGAWVQEVYDRYAIWSDRDGTLYQQDYSVASDGSVAFAGQAQEVHRKVTYEPITNQKGDQMKDTIVAALNKAGIQTAGKTDDQLLQDYDALRIKPHADAAVAANSKVAEFETNAKRAADEELTAIASELATNSSSLKAEDFKAMGLARCKELKATAAPVAVGGKAAGNAEDAYATYDPNEHFAVKKEA